MTVAIKLTRNYYTNNCLIEPCDVPEDGQNIWTPIYGGWILIQVYENEQHASWGIEWWIKESGVDTEYVDRHPYDHPDYLTKVAQDVEDYNWSKGMI